MGLNSCGSRNKVRMFWAVFFLFGVISNSSSSSSSGREFHLPLKHFGVFARLFVG